MQTSPWAASEWMATSGRPRSQPGGRVGCAGSATVPHPSSQPGDVVFLLGYRAWPPLAMTQSGSSGKIQLWMLSESCTDRMNSDCPSASRPLHGQLPPQIRHCLKEGATRTLKPQQPVLPNAKPTAGLEGKWLRGHSRARCAGRAHGSQGEGQDTWTF